MTRIDLNRPLAPHTVAKVLEYLEKRPLGEVLSLFNELVAQLEVRDGQPAIRSDADFAGGGDTGISGDSVPPVAAQ